MVPKHRIDWNDDTVSRLWDYYSKTPPYSAIYFSKLFGRQLIKKSGLPFNTPLSVLDFGCGPGFIWDHLCAARTLWQYTGLDFSSDAIAILSEKANGHSHFEGAHHITKLPSELQSEQFDAVLLFEVVEHLNDVYLDETLREVFRLLKNGGIVVVSTPNEENLSEANKFCPECGAIYHEWQHVRSWSVASLTSCFAKYGFDLVKAQTLDFTVTGLLRRLYAFYQSLTGSNNKKPHMVATFRKLPTRD
jgi:2-polyprenyl-3-methyl-5-hydroxy-6-metoxy-1,4-benzoquinol methylase